jgi:HEAT repeat protein
MNALQQHWKTFYLKPKRNKARGTNMKKLYICSIIMVCFILYSNLSAQTVIKITDSDLNLISRWDKAVQTGETNQSFWIGYSIKRLMGENSYIGSFSDDDDRPSLADVISGKVSELKNMNSDSRHKNFVWNEEKSIEKILKDVAIIFEVTKENNSNFRIRKIEMTNLELPFEFYEMKLYWLGNTDHDESIAFLKNQFQQSNDSEIREDLVTAIGIHDNNMTGYNFLKDVIDGSDIDDVREQAVFWIARHENKEVLPLLRKLAVNDRSEDVREKAVFGLYISDTDEAVDVLIELAKNANNTDIRKKAMFWLGQTASKKAVKTIEDAVYNDEETEIQKQAVFALSQLDKDEGLDKLIKVAKTHPNPEIRKKAIFWLGQSDDDRALDALIGFLKN